jgi:hypothetical protein
VPLTGIKGPQWGWGLASPHPHRGPFMPVSGTAEYGCLPVVFREATSSCAVQDHELGGTLVPKYQTYATVMEKTYQTLAKMIKSNTDDEAQYSKVYSIIGPQMQWFQDRLELSVKMEQEVMGNGTTPKAKRAKKFAA